jgi:dihydropteroate synthase
VTLSYRIGDRVHDLARRGLVLGIVNVTPDSFSDGGRFFDADAACGHGMRLVEEGADALDIGGESTRPGSEGVSAEEEIARVRPVIERLAPRAGVPLSIDTSKLEVARVALDLGAAIVNDVSGLRLRDAAGRPALAGLAAEHRASLIVMHMQGAPRTMQRDPRYDDVVGEVGDFLGEAARAAEAAGVARDRIAIDPGIGFGKSLEHSLELLRRMDGLAALGYPVMIGVSRKSLFEKLLGLPVTERLEAGLAASVLAFERGARLFRTHDVRATVRALRTAEALL